MIGQKFQIYGVKITGKYICESKKMNLFNFTHDPSRTLPQVLTISPQAEGNYSFPRTAFSENLFYPNNIFTKNYSVHK